MKILAGTVALLTVCYLFGCSGEGISNSSGKTDVKAVSLEPGNRPLLSTGTGNTVARICIVSAKPGKAAGIRKMILGFSKESRLEDLAFVRVICEADPGEGIARDSLYKFIIRGNKVIIKGRFALQEGENRLSIVAGIRENANLDNVLELEKADIFPNRGKMLTVSRHDPIRLRYALVLRASGQDGCDTYRIPGLITTGRGTLVAVYDARYNRSKDLQENIDVGMSRSTDGGQTWEPMKIIIDMGEYGGLPKNMNGVGDPCILYDNKNDVIWVAALWLNGSSPDKMAWWDSKPGMLPGETGQFILVKSTDDGLTWSEPVNITSQIKKPEWQLLLQGPGKGITMTDGTFVFPAQFKANTGEKALDGGIFTPFSTIVYSRDGGETWTIGTGAKSNTTEAQVVELPDGSLMLNMRDDRNRTEKGSANGRAVYTSADMGTNWTVHPSSNSVLTEPNCMASIIASDIGINGKLKRVLFFSNPDHDSERINMTIKASLDNGFTWPGEFRLLLNGAAGYGYSCLTMVNDSTLGIVYEGMKDLYYQKIRVRDVLNN
ncbi:MAG TPA: sialidase family protein [Bacteroidales bacterium]|nr:sialidase family protein [Bacteroidales bacterium]